MSTNNLEYWNPEKIQIIDQNYCFKIAHPYNIRKCKLDNVHISHLSQYKFNKYISKYITIYLVFINNSENRL